MWLKSILFLSYAGSLVAPSSAISRQDEVVPGKQAQPLPREDAFPRLQGHQRPWANQTRSPEPQESETLVVETQTGSAVVVTSENPQATTTKEDKSSSAIFTELPSSTLVLVTDAPVPESSSTPVEAPGQSNSTPISDITSGAELPNSSTAQEESVTSTSIAPPPSSGADATMTQVSSSASISTPKVSSELITTSTGFVSTSESVPSSSSEFILEPESTFMPEPQPPSPSSSAMSSTQTPEPEPAPISEPQSSNQFSSAISSTLSSLINTPVPEPTPESAPELDPQPSTQSSSALTSAQISATTVLSSFSMSEPQGGQTSPTPQLEEPEKPEAPAPSPSPSEPVNEESSSQLPLTPSPTVVETSAVESPSTVFSPPVRPSPTVETTTSPSPTSAFEEPSSITLPTPTIEESSPMSLPTSLPEDNPPTLNPSTISTSEPTSTPGQDIPIPLPSSTSERGNTTVLEQNPTPTPSPSQSEPVPVPEPLPTSTLLQESTVVSEPPLSSVTSGSEAPVTFTPSPIPEIASTPEPSPSPSSINELDPEATPPNASSQLVSEPAQTPSITEVTFSTVQPEPSDPVLVTDDEITSQTTAPQEQIATLSTSPVVEPTSDPITDGSTIQEFPAEPTPLEPPITSSPLFLTQTEELPQSTPTLAPELLPTSVVESVLSSVLSEASSIVSDVLVPDPSNILSTPLIPSPTPTGEPIGNATQTSPSFISTELAPIPVPTSLFSNIEEPLSSVLSEVPGIPTAVSSVLSSAIPDAESGIIPTTIDGRLSSSIFSDIVSSISVLPIPMSEISSILTPSLSIFQTSLPLPSNTDLPLSFQGTGLPFSSQVVVSTQSEPFQIPVSETLGVSTEVPTVPPTPSASIVLTPSGISLPGASGTGIVPAPIDSPTSSNLISSQVVPTAPAVPESSFLGVPTTPVLASPSQIAQPSVSTSVFDPLAGGANQTVPTAGASGTPGLPSNQLTRIPASETPAIPPTSPLTALPSSIPLSRLPSPGFNAGISLSDRPSLGTTVDFAFAFPTTVSSASVRVESNPEESASPENTTAGADTSANPSDPSALDSGAFTLPADGASLGPSGPAPTGFVVSTSPAPAASSTVAVAGGGDPSPPPLSKSQTAGIAVGGTTCLLIALVAALFLARRYHANSAKRKSTGSVYPKVAYLYDPPERGHGDAEAGGAVPAMSGGATGFAATARHISEDTRAAPPSSARHSTRHSTGSLPQDPFRDPIIPSPAPSRSPDPRETMRQSRYPSMGMVDARGSYAQLSINPYNFNPVSKEYPPLSPYGPLGGAAAPNHNLPPVAQRQSDVSSDRWSDPFADPFEHDLLLNVDSRGETPDSILVVAPPATPRSPHTPGRYTPETDSSSNSLAPPAGRYTSTGRNSPLNRSLNSSSNSLTEPGRGKYSDNMIYTSPSQTNLRAMPITITSPKIKQVTSPKITQPKRAASPPPIHKGWDEIRDDDTSMAPQPLNIGGTIKKKPVPARTEPTLAGQGQTMSGIGLPLGVKRKEVGNGAELTVKLDRSIIPKPLGSANSLAVPRGMFGSPGPTITEFDDDQIHRKRSAELSFANPQHVGRQI